MMNDWKNTRANLVKGGANFSEANGPVATAFRKLEQSTAEGDVLGAKTRELISLAVAVTTRCDGCISAHAAAAQVVACLREGVLTAQLRNRHSGLRFPQETNDLFFAESLLHVQSPCRGGLDSKARRYSIPGGRRQLAQRSRSVSG